MIHCIFAIMIGGQIAVCIHPDATVTYTGNIDVAAKAFWDEVAKRMPPEVAKRMPPDDCKPKVSQK